MAIVVVNEVTGFDNHNFWVANGALSNNEQFEGFQSASGNPLIGAETLTFSDLTFTYNDLKYTYHGQWNLTIDREPLNTVVSADGFYTSVEIDRAGQLVAAYTSGPAIDVDFGSRTGVSPTDTSPQTVLPLLIGNDGPPNLYLDLTPNLPDMAFAFPDLMWGGVGGDTLTGFNGSDGIAGGDGNDVLNGGGGDDFLIGGAGADDLTGGGGNDIAAYVTSPFGLQASLNDPSLNTGDALGDRYHGIMGLMGSNYIDSLEGDGNTNILDGGASADILSGRGGDDWYVVDNPGDVVIESAGGGSDRVFTGVSYVLNSGAEVETLSTTDNFGLAPIALAGNEFNNIIFGNSGDNFLDGRGGADVLVGFGGNDSYLVDAADSVFEAVGGGADRVFASQSFVLTAGQEIETLSTDYNAATAPINLTGNDLANVIFGNAGANTLDGGGGNDVLVGFGGPDVFVFDTPLNDASNIDTIADFSNGEDLIRLDHAVFSGAGAPGTLAAAAFAAGPTALDADDRVIYDNATGSLFYDPDGSGSGAAVQFARVTPGLGLTHADFVIG